MRKFNLYLLLFLISLFFPLDSSSQQDNVLKIGVASMITPVDTVKYYQEIIDYIGEQIYQPVQMVHRRTYAEMDGLLERGEVKEPGALQSVALRIILLMFFSSFQLFYE